MASTTLNYKCPACSGALQFSEETGKLQCNFCDSAYDPAEIEALYGAKADTVAASEARTADSARVDTVIPEVLDDPIAQYLNRAKFSTDETQGLVAYSCSSCGAELLCDTTTAVAMCPYCSNPTIVPAKLSGALRPDYVIGFKKTKEEAMAGLRNYYKGKKFLPREFADENKIQEIQGIYVPFWLYDGEVSGRAVFDATDVRTWSDSRFQYTETTKYELERAGRMGFSRVPADGSVKMPDAHMDAIEPYDYSDLVPFSIGYLPGFIADRFDVDASDCRDRVDARLAQSIEDALQSTTGVHDTVTTRSSSASVTCDSISYALLPVWMLHTRYNDEDFLFAMNGQTGKVAGDLPVSKGKVAAWFIGLFVLFAIILGAAGAFFAS
jgi:DNA-directed RNA polymerase subunit RPC12/RpoP